VQVAKAWASHSMSRKGKEERRSVHQAQLAAARGHQKVMLTVVL